MSAERFSTWARWVSVAVLTAAWLGFAVAPASAQDTSAAKARESKAHTSSLSLNASAAASAPAAAPANRGGSFLNGFVYATGPQSLGFRGRVNVGKTGVYVPYYGNVDTDPLHPNSQTSAGIGYGFRTWDISVMNGNSAGVANVPGGGDAPRSQSLSFSVRF
jgi:hypothetical protein